MSRLTFEEFAEAYCKQHGRTPGPYDCFYGGQSVQVESESQKREQAVQAAAIQRELKWILSRIDQMEIEDTSLFHLSETIRERIALDVPGQLILDEMLAEFKAQIAELQGQLRGFIMDLAAKDLEIHQLKAQTAALLEKAIRLTDEHVTGMIVHTLRSMSLNLKDEYRQVLETAAVAFEKFPREPFSTTLIPTDSAAALAERVQQAIEEFKQTSGKWDVDPANRAAAGAPEEKK